MKICKLSPVSPNPRNAQNYVQFRLNSTGDIIFQQVMYPRQYRRKIMCKFIPKIKTPAIPVIPGILSVSLSKFTIRNLIMNID